jgi:hypothetical protein
MPAGRKIVLAVDDSPISQDAVDWASKKLLNPNDEVHLISVLDPGQRPDISTAGESSYVLLENTVSCLYQWLQLFFIYGYITYHK